MRMRVTWGERERGATSRQKQKVYRPMKKSSRWLIGTAFIVFIATIFLNGPTFAESPAGVTNIFKPLSVPAQAIYDVSLLALAICAGIFLVVGGLLAYTV